MTNLAAMMPELGRIEIQEVPTPTATGREVVVAIQAVGVCGSDATFFNVGYIGDWVVSGPMILGHEASGIVEAVGPDVSQVSVGDRVAIEPGTPCRDCEQCTAGRYHLCVNFRFLATPPNDGALVQLLAIDERNLFILPDSMSFEDGAMLEPLSVGIWACKRANLQAGDDVLVTGAGPVGVLAAQVARALGAGSVTISDLSPFRLDIAEKLGINVERADAPSDRKFDVVLECSGAPGVLASALARLRENGRAAMVGLPKAPVELPLSQLNAKEISLALVNRYAHTWPTAIDLVSSGRVDVSSIVTHEFPLSETGDAITLAARDSQSLKAIIYPQR